MSDPQRPATLPWTSATFVAVVVACTYVLSARMSLALLTPDGVAVFWPAAGIASGTLIVLGPPARLAVVVGTMIATIVANLLGDRNLFSSLVFAMCNAGEALLAAGLIWHYLGASFNLGRLRHVLGLIAAAIVATALSGIGGALGFAFFHNVAGTIFATWEDWFASDALGIITIAPLIIGLAAAVSTPPARSEIIEGLVALSCLVVTSLIVISLPSAPWTTVVPIALLFPVLLWIAARCPPIFAAAAVFIVTLAIVWTTTVEIGHFGDPGLPMAQRVLSARLGILAVAFCAYVLAALFAERRQQQAELAESEARLQEALTAGMVTTFAWDVGSGLSQRSANAAEILGYDAREGLSATDFLMRVHPVDRERLKALVRDIRAEGPTYSIVFPFRHSDGRDIWLEETARAEFDPLGRRVRFKGLTLDITARKQAEDQKNLLISVLDRQVKKLLARIAVVAKDSHHSVGTADEYIRALDGRIQSMADAHALLSKHRWQGAPLAELIRRQLAFHASDANVVLAGQETTLSVSATQALGMVLHELVTNAARYGALSTPFGRVEVGWKHEADSRNLSIEWSEIGGPPIAAPPGFHYGLGIIRDVIPHELGGSVDLAFAPTGLCCKMTFPMVTEGEAGS